jgi:two-component system response regulator NreC
VQTRILIVDDQTLFREGVRRIVEEREGFHVVGEAQDGEEALTAVDDCEPDVILMDVAMPRMSGIYATRRIAENGRSVKVLMVSESEAISPVEESLRAGAAGYVSKSATSQELLAAIEAVRLGGSYLSPDIATKMARIAVTPGASPSPMAVLSDREREVLTWLAEGYSSREIGERLGISPKTIDSHRVRLMKKLGIHKVQSLVRFAIREGLLQP